MQRASEVKEMACIIVLIPLDGIVYPSYLQRLLRTVRSCSIVHNERGGAEASQSNASPDSSKTEGLGSTL
jgi:hypothetical protein